MTKSKDISSRNNNDLVVSDIELNTILDTIADGKEVSHRVIKNTLGISSRKWQTFLEKNPKVKAEFEKAQETGIKVLVEKMLDIFNSEHMDLSPNELLFIREKKDFLKWLSPKISSLFQDKQKLDVRSDSTIKISWEDNSNDLIDVSGDTIDVPPNNKD
jgi:hypothetical protein